MARTYVFRLTAEGVKELERDLKSMADNSGTSLDSLKAKFPGLSSVIEDANRKLDEHRRRQGDLPPSFDKSAQSLGTLIGRYATWVTIIATANRLAHTAAETSDEMSDALKRQEQAWNDLASAAAPPLTFVYNRLTDIAVAAGNVVKGVKDAAAEIARAPLLGGPGGRTVPMSQLGPPIPYDPGAFTFATMGKDRNWTPGPGGFPAAGVTDLTANEAEAQKQLDAAYKFADELEKADRERMAKRIDDEEELQQKLLADALKYADELEKADRERMARRIDGEEELQQRLLADALKYADELAASLRESQQRRADDLADDLKRQQKESEEYWRNVTDDMRFVAKDFWLDFAETGKLNFKGLTDQMRTLWASVLFDMARQGKLFGSDGMFGGGAFGSKPGQIGAVGGALSAAALLAGAFGDPNGNTRISGGLGGAASGALYGSSFGPIGTAIGAGIGGLIGLLGGNDKPSNYRATATFGSGMGGFSLSGDKPNENTLSLAQQAAAAIMAEVQSLKAFGVEFQQQLANVWIGQRDASTYQLVGGQRISVGSVGNAGDLAQDTLTALLKGATSSDPMIQGVLKSGAPDLMKALQFAQGITEALAEITTPLEHALDLWQKTAAANVAMAQQSGYSLEKIAQYNESLRSQIVEQYFGPTQSSLTGFIQNLQFGPGSTASPEKQYTAAFSSYDAARDAALKNATPETVAAFLGQANTFLPIARGYWASSQPYGALEQGALNTAQQLQGMITSMMSGSDSTVMAITSTGAAQLEATQEQTGEVRLLREEVRDLRTQIGALLARVVA